MFYELLFDTPLKQSFLYAADDKAAAAAGRRAMAQLGRRQILGYIIAEQPDLPAGLDEKRVKKIQRVVDKEPLFGADEVLLARWIASYYFCSPGEALAAMLPSGRRAIAAPSFITGIDEGIASSGALTLSSEQEAALQAITAHCDHKTEGGAPFYLYGITGSGKTEVFLRAAEYVLRLGKSVIYLVPEIALTHQTAQVIGRRFGNAAATLHSAMSGSERLAEWMRIKRGEARIVVGPRSAIFSPMNNLGLVIIDEEHDGSFKSSNTPRYHGRQVAMRRCAVSGAALVMGSATPSAEAWKLMEDKRICRLDLSARLSGGKPPEVKAVSLEHSSSCLTIELQREIRETALMGRQTILFLNRRGFAYFYHCKECGYELMCKRCSVSLTWHKARGKAVCHYCGYEAPPPAACPQCGSIEAGFRGIGTEMVEEEVKARFPDLRVRRIDADTAEKKGSLENTLALFKAGGLDILLGTQMVAKGLNFPGVRLVGVIFADTGLHLPDFRAAERTFSLIVQVAGRAGRFFPDGKVLVQTLRPFDPVIQAACALDVAGFFKAELENRQMQGFPPYSRVIRIVGRCRESRRADAAMARLFALARPLLPRGTDVLGPAESPLSLVAGNYRRQLIFRGADMSTLHNAVGRALAAYETGKDTRVYLEIDVDPSQLL